MNIKIIVLGIDGSQADVSYDDMLFGVFAEHLADNDSVLYFPTLKDATVAVSKAFTEADTVIFLIKEERYGADKRLLCKALGLSFETDAVIRAMALHSAGDSFAEDAQFDETHCRIPKGAKSFVLDDGLYAGFAAVKGTQTTVVLPMSPVRTSHLLVKQVIPYLNSSYNVEIPTDLIRRRYVGSFANSIGDNDISVAVSGTNSAKIFAEYISGNTVLENAVVFSGHAEPRRNVPPNEYVVSLSITAAELLGAPYGIAISNAFYSGDSADSEKTVYMAVTNDAETVVRVVHSLPFEDVNDFMTRCCGEMCRLLTETIEVDTGVRERPAPPKKQKNTGLVAAIFVVIIMLAGVVGYGASVFKTNNYSLKEWYNTYISKYSHYTFDLDGTSAVTGENKTEEKTESNSASVSSTENDVSEKVSKS